MCEACVEEITDGRRPPMTDAMWDLAGLAWDWYRLEGNSVGGALHIVLDDYNVDDEELEWCRSKSIETLWLDERTVAPPEYVAAATAILDGLGALTVAERAMVVHFANPYGSTRPARP